LWLCVFITPRWRFQLGVYHRFPSLLSLIDSFFSKAQMPITFGSFGDIIAAVQVAYVLIEVLNSQGGAKREFRETLVDLRLFHHYLDQVSCSERNQFITIGLTELSFSRSGKHAKMIPISNVFTMFCTRPFPMRKQKSVHSLSK
jgi:hypothetical protein